MPAPSVYSYHASGGGALGRGVIRVAYTAVLYIGMLTEHYRNLLWLLLPRYDVARFHGLAIQSCGRHHRLSKKVADAHDSPRWRIA